MAFQFRNEVQLKADLATAQATAKDLAEKTNPLGHSAWVCSFNEVALVDAYKQKTPAELEMEEQWKRKFTGAKSGFCEFDPRAFSQEAADKVKAQGAKAQGAKATGNKLKAQGQQKQKVLSEEEKIIMKEKEKPNPFQHRSWIRETSNKTPDSGYAAQNTAVMKVVAKPGQFRERYPGGENEDFMPKAAVYKKTGNKMTPTSNYASQNKSLDELMKNPALFKQQYPGERDDFKPNKNKKK